MYKTYSRWYTSTIAGGVLWCWLLWGVGCTCVYSYVHVCTCVCTGDPPSKLYSSPFARIVRIVCTQCVHYVRANAFHMHVVCGLRTHLCTFLYTNI